MPFKTLKAEELILDIDAIFIEAHKKNKNVFDLIKSIEDKE